MTSNPKAWCLTSNSSTPTVCVARAPGSSLTSARAIAGLPASSTCSLLPAIYGYQGQLGIGTANPVTVRYDFQSESLVLDEQFIDPNGLRGTRSRFIANVRQGNRRVAGQLHLQPTPGDLRLSGPARYRHGQSRDGPV